MEEKAKSDQNGGMTDKELDERHLRLQNRITEVMLRVFAVQSFLQQEGVCTAAEVDARIEEIRPRFDALVAKSLAEQTEKQLQQAIDQLLRELPDTGPKQ